MALQYSVAVRNARLDSVETTIGTSARLKIFSGSVPANCAAADPAGLLATLVLPSDWLGAAAAGVKSLAGSWTVAASGGAPTNAASWRLYASDGTTCGAQGTVTVTGGGGDLTLDNISINTGQTITVNTWAITAANA